MPETVFDTLAERFLHLSKSKTIDASSDLETVMATAGRKLQHAIDHELLNVMDWPSWARSIPNGTMIVHDSNGEPGERPREFWTEYWWSVLMWFASARPEAGIVLRSTGIGAPDDWQIRNCEMFDWLYSGHDGRIKQRLRTCAAASCDACRFLAGIVGTERPATKDNEGEWSLPMTKKELAACVDLNRYAFEGFGKRHGLRKISRQLFQLRLDGMDPATKRRFGPCNAQQSDNSHTQLH